MDDWEEVSVSDLEIFFFFFLILRKKNGCALESKLKKEGEDGMQPYIYTYSVMIRKNQIEI